jgi:hypothetical protein
MMIESTHITTDRLGALPVDLVHELFPCILSHKLGDTWLRAVFASSVICRLLCVRRGDSSVQFPSCIEAGSDSNGVFVNFGIYIPHKL